MNSDSATTAVPGDELARLVDGVRRLIETTVTVTADTPDETLSAAREEVERAIAWLRPHVPDPVPPRYPTKPVLDDPATLMPYDPLIGRLNPLAVPIHFEWQEPRAIGRVTFGTPYEGPPRCVHGGMIAAAFDQVFNVANVMRGIAGPTKRLEIRFRRPTPLLTELRFEGWQEAVDDREIHTAGRLIAGDVVCVEAQGWFAQMSPERVMRLLDPDGGGDDRGKGKAE